MTGSVLDKKRKKLAFKFNQEKVSWLENSKYGQTATRILSRQEHDSKRFCFVC